MPNDFGDLVDIIDDERDSIRRFVKDIGDDDPKEVREQIVLYNNLGSARRKLIADALTAITPAEKAAIKHALEDLGDMLLTEGTHEESVSAAKAMMQAGRLDIQL